MKNRNPDPDIMFSFELVFIAATMPILLLILLAFALLAPTLGIFSSPIHNPNHTTYQKEYLTCSTVNQKCDCWPTPSP